MLVRQVHVHHTNDSIARLMAISCHPEIKKGVRTVRVDLRCVDTELDRSFFSFATNILAWLERGVFSKNTALCLPPKADLDGIRKAHSVIQSWCRLLSVRPPFTEVEESPEPYFLESSDETSETEQESDPEQGSETDEKMETDEGLETEEDKMNLLFLRMLHEEHRRLSAEYEALARNGTFSETVGIAFARMPYATDLRFDDRAPSRLWEDMELSIYHGDIYGGVYRHLLHPGAEIMRGDSIDKPQTYNSILQLPIAIQDAGGLIHSIKITVIDRIPDRAMKFTARTLGRLGKAVEPLQRFSLQYGKRDPNRVDPVRHVLPRRPALWEGHRDWIRLFCRAGLQTLDLEMFVAPELNAQGPALGTVATLFDVAVTRSNLRDIHLDGVFFTKAEILSLLKAVPSTLNSVTMSDAFLLDGDWTDVFDAMAAKSYTGSVRFYLLKGGGFAPFEYYDHLESSYYKRAAQYVVGEIHYNPWRVVEEDTESSDTNSASSFDWNSDSGDD